MTRERILAMPAGPEMDAQVDLLVMGAPTAWKIEIRHPGRGETRHTPFRFLSRSEATNAIRSWPPDKTWRGWEPTGQIEESLESDPPRYSTSDADAVEVWKVMNAMAGQHPTAAGFRVQWRIDSPEPARPGRFEAGLFENSPESDFIVPAVAPTLALAICRAALLTKEETGIRKKS